MSKSSTSDLTNTNRSRIVTESPSECGGIGRRTRLKICWELIPWGFKSPHSHLNFASVLMDDYDDFSLMDLVEEIHDTLDLEENKNEEETLEEFLKSNWDF